MLEVEVLEHLTTVEGGEDVLRYLCRFQKNWILKFEKLFLFFIWIVWFKEVLHEYKILQI